MTFVDYEPFKPITVLIKLTNIDNVSDHMYLVHHMLEAKRMENATDERVRGN